MEIKDVEGALAKGLEPIATKLGEIEGRVSAMEKLPLAKTLNVNTISTEYKGRKLSKMGASLRELGAKNARDYGVFSNDEKMDAFNKFMIDVVTKTTLNETTGSTGAYLVPDEFQFDIVTLARNKSYALQLAKVINMNSDTLYIPAELTLPTVAWKGESVQLAQADGTFAQVKLEAKKLTAYSWATNEVLADSGIDVVSMITEQMAYGMGLELDNQMLNGTGDPVSGLATASCGYSVTLTTASMSAVSASDFSLMISKLESGDLANARFILGRLALHYVRSLKDSQSYPIFAHPAGNVSGTIYDFPYILTDKLTNTDADNAIMAIFGDFSKFIIGRRSGAMVIESDPYTRFDYAETKFRMISRWALAIGRSTAFCRLLA